MSKYQMDDISLRRQADSPWFIILSKEATSRAEIQANKDLQSVLGSLARLKALNHNGLALTVAEEKVIRITLEWYKSATGGTEEIHKKWDTIGIPYTSQIPEASAQIFTKEWAPSDADMDTAKDVEGLDDTLKDHLEATLGQGIMLAMTTDEDKLITELIRTSDMFTRQLLNNGGVDKDGNVIEDANPFDVISADDISTTELKSLKEVYAPFGGEFMRTVLYYLNQCMIEPDAEDAWEKYKDAIYDAILEVVEYLES